MKYLVLLLLLAACGKKNDYVYSVKGFHSEVVSNQYRVISDGGQVDIVWVIDNSGSMSDIQDSVIQNADSFMQEFIKVKGLDWRMTLLSTDIDEQPYLGLPSFFDYTHPDPVTAFRNAVSQLGTSGSATEQSFDPIIKQLNAHPNFLRPSAFLVVFFVTDEYEQSNINAARFIDDLVARKSGRLGMIRAYGAIDAEDLGCGGDDYAGGAYEAAINGLQGRVIPTCNTQFGVELAKLGSDIVSIVASSVIMLEKRPIPATLKVTYSGTELPPGPKEQGGYWTYDPDANGVRFHDYSFLQVNQKFIQIDFEVDQGQRD